MSDPHVQVSESGRYRRRGPLEVAGGWIARRVPGGRIRDALRSVYRTLLGRRALECRLPGGETVLISPDHRFVTWNPAEYEAFREATTTGATVLDIGANVGAYSLVFGRWAGGEGKVFAFEPSRDARAALEQHVALNGLADRIEVRAEAVAAESGSASFVEEGIHGTSRLGGGAATVPVTSIDDFCAGRGLTPSVIKVDVEGAELEVLRGARRTLGAAIPPAVFVELHPTLWPSAGVTREAIEAELRVHGLRVQPLRGGVDPWTLEGECVRLVRE